MFHSKPTKNSCAPVSVPTAATRGAWNPQKAPSFFYVNCPTRILVLQNTRDSLFSPAPDINQNQLNPNRNEITIPVS
jgi:hypothetical protein